MRIILKAFIAVCAIGMVWGLALSFLSDTEFKTQLHTASVAWLPPEAKDVSTQTRSGFGAVELVECTIPPAEFQKLAVLKNWQLEEIRNEMIYGRIEGLSPLREHPDIGASDFIENGLFSESRASNGGGYTVWYDLDLQRMIYSWSHR